MEKEELKELIKEVCQEGFNMGQIAQKIDHLTNLFKDHKEDDEKHLTNLYNIGRELPQKVMDTIEGKMKDKYVTRDEYHELRTILTNNHTELKSSITAKLDSIRFMGGILGLIIAGIQIYKLFA